MTKPAPTVETYQEALRLLTKAAFRRDGEDVETFARIPADPTRDADLLLADALSELATLRQREEQSANALKQAERWMHDPDENATERFERIADEFFRSTGYMRPGKSQPLGWGHSDEERQRIWDEWSTTRSRVVLAAIRAALAQTADQDSTTPEREDERMTKKTKTAETDPCGYEDCKRVAEFTRFDIETADGGDCVDLCASHNAEIERAIAAKKKARGES